MTDEADNNPRLRVVGVGSSAGGLDAVAKLLSAASVDAPWCFIVAQHRSPIPGGALVEIIARHTALSVATAIEGAPVQRGSVYVAPPNYDIVVERGSIRLLEPRIGTRPWPSIDRLFAALATEFGSDAVAVVLSGTGHDGAAGSKEIRDGGGVVVVQDPATASFDEMPRSALATGSANMTSTVEAMADELRELLFGEQPPPVSLRIGPDQHDVEDNLTDKRTDVPDEDPTLLDSELDGIVDALHQATGIDYSGYKRSTLSRQIERRRRGRGISAVAYAAELPENSAEAGALARAILVSVTSFFRDGAVWESVGPRLRVLASTLTPGETLRLWVPGCATGEEAYTVAMLAADALDDGTAGLGLGTRLKVFATDLDDAALTIARRGHYTASSIAAVPQRLRDRWMYHSSSGWAVVPELRECMVIARHNVAYDPPFPRVHLISLRNTLIYFETRLQARVMDLCHYALVPDGLVVLGLSERISDVDAAFTAVDYTHRIYRRGDSSRSSSTAIARHLPGPTARGIKLPAVSRNQARAASELPYRHILQATGPPMLILDDRDVLIEVIGDVSAWCSIGDGRHTGSVTEILRDPYRLGVRTLLSQLRRTDSIKARLVTEEHPPVRITASVIPTDSVTRTVLTFVVDESSPVAASELGEVVAPSFLSST